MRFDDSLATVLAADTATVFGAAAAWRQLVDLTARGRVRDVAAAVERLGALRDQVPVPVRAASARALAAASPPAALVTLFARDEPSVAAPVLRFVQLAIADWLALLPRLSPATRSILRHRRDLPAEVMRGLESFGSTDFVLDGPVPVAVVPAPVAPRPIAPIETPFVAVGEIARALPVVAEAMRRSAEQPALVPNDSTPRSDIADLVARIDAFRRDKPTHASAPAPATPAEHFAFETDAAGTIRWVDGISRGMLIGATLAHGGRQGAAQFDAAIGGALRARSAFRDLRLEIAGKTPVAGSWRVSGVPRFDRQSGRFQSFAGVARRPRRDQVAAPPVSASDSLRQLLHELRTPANAIAGFSELIGTELFGPVPPIYRDRARLIQREAVELTTAIEDLDTAARLEGATLELRPGTLDLSLVLATVMRSLHGLAVERGVALAVDAEPGALVQADDRALARLLDRLLTALIAVALPGERLRVQLSIKTRSVRLHVTRPRALPAGGDEALLAIDAEAERDGGPLLGVGFTLRLVRNLAAALGGSLQIEPDRLTLRLPTAQVAEVERATG